MIRRYTRAEHTVAARQEMTEDTKATQLPRGKFRSTSREEASLQNLLAQCEPEWTCHLTICRESRRELGLTGGETPPISGGLVLIETHRTCNAESSERNRYPPPSCASWDDDPTVLLITVLGWPERASYSVRIGARPTRLKNIGANFALLNS